jgi:aryl-alcohol dehydrogenase-like predicted oxidoreductase
MGLSHGYGPGVDEDEAIVLMRKAFDLRYPFSTAVGYAAGANEQLVGRALAPIRRRVIIATKLRPRSDTDGRKPSWCLRRRCDRPVTCMSGDMRLRPGHRYGLVRAAGRGGRQRHRRAARLWRSDRARIRIGRTDHPRPPT